MERVKAQRATWLRDERRRAYGNLSVAGEEALQFIRTDLVAIVGSTDESARTDARTQWRALRTELRKAYNQVLLLGAPETRVAALDMWRIARNGVEDLLRVVDAPDCPTDDEVRKRIKELASALGSAGGPYMTACRKDLHGEEL
jgi:hypothetical protein